MTSKQAIDWTFYQAIEYFISLKEIQCARHIIEHGIDIEKVKQALVNEYDYQPHIVNYFLDNAIATVKAETLVQS